MGMKTITIGNPYVGKSSVLNSLSGENLFTTGKREEATDQDYKLDKKKNKKGDYSWTLQD